MAHDESLTQLLQDYEKLEQDLADLEEQKKLLRAKIQHRLEADGKTFYGAEHLTVALKQQTVIVYDEEMLRRRLGAQYVRILEPDVKKIKQQLPQLLPALTPYLDRIGTPARDLIKQLILDGELDRQAFQGAFEKTLKTTLYVRKRPPPANDLNKPHTPY